MKTIEMPTTTDEQLVEMLTSGRDEHEYHNEGDDSNYFEVEASPTFRDLVVFTPPHRQAFCIEPYTCLPDSIRLATEGHETGLMILQPGEAFETTIPISVSTCWRRNTAVTAGERKVSAQTRNSRS